MLNMRHQWSRVSLWVGAVGLAFWLSPLAWTSDPDVKYVSAASPPCSPVTDVALVTSLRDGMNLVSYEYVACQSDNAGVLVLSEFAGEVLFCWRWRATRQGAVETQ